MKLQVRESGTESPSASRLPIRDDFGPVPFPLEQVRKKDRKNQVHGGGIDFDKQGPDLAG